MRVVTILFILLYTSLFCRDNKTLPIKELTPIKITPINLSKKGEEEFKHKERLFIKFLNGKKLNDDELKKVDSFDETKSNYWQIIGDGDNWYNLGGPKKIEASTTLKSLLDINYSAKNAHDLSYKSAWVEGEEGYGIHEYLLYTFDAKSPRVTKINVVNGYVKSQKLWFANSRVKKMKLYINNRGYAILNLEDLRATQTFEIEPLGCRYRDNLKLCFDWSLKFEILEVYKGSKYKDTVITEIYFDGIDVL